MAIRPDRYRQQGMGFTWNLYDLLVFTLQPPLEAYGLRLCTLKYFIALSCQSRLLLGILPFPSHCESAKTYRDSMRQIWTAINDCSNSNGSRHQSSKYSMWLLWTSQASTSQAFWPQSMSSRLSPTARLPD